MKKNNFWLLKSEPNVWSINHQKKMGSKYFWNSLDDQKTKGKRQVKGSKKNSNSKIQSKASGKANMSGIRKVGRGN